MVDKSSGRSYKGDWECGLRSGKGRMEYGDGCTYDGQWKDDLRHGQGVFVSPAEGTYEGQWLAGRKDGKGKMTFVYVRQSTRSPPFTHSLARSLDRSLTVRAYETQHRNGDSYDGNWKQNAFNGTGTLIIASYV